MTAQTDSLIPVSRCPVCRATSRSQNASAFKKDGGQHYLKHAASRLGMTVSSLGDSITVVECSSCRTAYCDPWLSRETASYVFTAAAPDHIAGWANFEHWLSSTRPNDMQAANRKLEQLLERRLGPIASYAELGCPFQGFLLDWKGREKPPSERLTLFSAALDREADVRWTASTRLYQNGARLARGLVVGYQRARAVKERLKSLVSRSLPSSKNAMPVRRVLLTQECAASWGNNCVRYGASCRYMAQRVLGADVLPLAEAPAVDLLGIFNGLDHTADPVATLKQGLSFASAIVVVTHHGSLAGKQHLFAFHEDFPRWLADELRPAVVSDITHDVLAGARRDNNYMLITRNKHA